jgi:hypothetical protein
MVTKMAMVAILVISASSDGYLFGELGCAKIIPQKSHESWPWQLILAIGAIVIYNDDFCTWAHFRVIIFL